MSYEYRRKRFANPESGTYTLVPEDEVVLCTGTFTISLMAADGGGGVYTLKNIGTGVITVDADGTETIDGELTQVLLENDSITIFDGASGLWYIL